MLPPHLDIWLAESISDPQALPKFSVSFPEPGENISFLQNLSDYTTSVNSSFLQSHSEGRKAGSVSSAHRDSLWVQEPLLVPTLTHFLNLECVLGLKHLFSYSHRQEAAWAAARGKW